MSDEISPFKAAYFGHLNPPVPAPEPEPEPKFENFAQIYEYHDGLFRKEQMQLNAHFKMKMQQAFQKAHQDAESILLRLRVDNYIREAERAEAAKAKGKQ